MKIYNAIYVMQTLKTIYYTEDGFMFLLLFSFLAKKSYFTCSISTTLICMLYVVLHIALLVSPALIYYLSDKGNINLDFKNTLPQSETNLCISRT